MRTMAGMAILCAASVVACGGDGGGGSGGSGGGGASMLVNGCDPRTAEDHTTENPLMVQFGGSIGAAYAPRCARMKAGDDVQFTGDLAAHPLAGGKDGVVDPSSPIEETKGGTMIAFKHLPAGVYPYFCEEHDAIGMNGALFVE